MHSAARLEKGMLQRAGYPAVTGTVQQEVKQRCIEATGFPAVMCRRCPALEPNTAVQKKGQHGIAGRLLLPHLPKENDFSRSRARPGGWSNPVGGGGGMLASGPLSAAVTSPAGAERQLIRCMVRPIFLRAWSMRATRAADLCCGDVTCGCRAAAVCVCVCVCVGVCV